MRGRGRRDPGDRLSLGRSRRANWPPRPPNAPRRPKKPAHRRLAEGAAIAERLAKIDVFSPADLILHLPLRYEDETRLTMLADVRPGVPAQREVEGALLRR